MVSGQDPTQVPSHQVCRLCGKCLATHPRCSGCGILAGQGHIEHSLFRGLCRTCAGFRPRTDQLWPDVGDPQN